MWAVETERHRQRQIVKGTWWQKRAYWNEQYCKNAVCMHNKGKVNMYDSINLNRNVCTEIESERDVDGDEYKEYVRTKQIKWTIN